MTATATAKRWRNAQAELLLGGWRAELLEAADKIELVASRWAQTRVFRDIDEAERFVGQVTGRSARVHQPRCAGGAPMFIGRSSDLC